MPSLPEMSVTVTKPEYIPCSRPVRSNGYTGNEPLLNADLDFTYSTDVPCLNIRMNSAKELTP